MYTSLRTQSLFAILALLAVMSMSWDTLQAHVQNFQAANHAPLENIGIQHTDPLSIRLEYTTKSGSALLQIHHDNGDGNTFISVPDNWERREVRNVDLQKIQFGEPSFGFVKWPLPSNASYQFWIPNAPRNILVHNPSGTPLKISLLKFNLETNMLEKNVHLIQSDTTKLW